MSYNLHEWDPAEADSPRRVAQRAMVARLGPDILCVQEFLVRTDHPDDPGLREGFGAFCEALGMRGRVAYARSHCHVGVLWRPELSLLGWRDYRHWPFHHTAGVATIDVGAGQPLRVASGHLSPFWPAQRAHEASLLGAIAPTAGWMLAGLDSNTIGDDPTYDPDPYQHQDPASKHHLFQIPIEPDQRWPPARPGPVDRLPAVVLTRHGLTDVAPALGAPWAPTSGHYPGGHDVARRVDVLRATPELLAHLSAYQVTDTREHPEALDFDHLPISCLLSVTTQIEHSGAAVRAGG